MKGRESVTLDLGGRGIEVANGYAGRGVFITILNSRGGRMVTLALPGSKPDDLARLLTQASAASRSREEA